MRTTSKQQQSNPFIQFSSFVCIILGSVALSLFYLTSWANSLIFDTNEYLKIVTPLPKDSTIAQALSTYTIDTLFSEINVEERIRTALPEQASFLASPLAEQLQERSLKRTTQIIQSDQFSSLWVASNTFFHQRILEIVRGGGILSQIQERRPLEEKNIQFDAGQMAQTIRDRLGSENRLFTDAQINQFRSITIPAYTKLENIRQIVYWISQLSAMLLPVSFALLILGIAIAFSRQKAFLTASITLIIVMVITLIILLIIRTELLNQITQSLYHNAAQVVWDNFVRNLTTTLWLTILGGSIIIGLTLLSGPYNWASNFRKAIGIAHLQKSSFMRGFNNLRMFLARYALWLILLGIIVAIIILFGMETLTIATVVVILSYLLLYIAILLLIFPRQRLV